MFETDSHVKLALFAFCNCVFSNETCSCCGKRVYINGLCKNCKKEFLDFVPAGAGRCSVCGKVLVSEEEKCTLCRNEAIIQSADSVFPLHGYRLWNKKLVFDWKIAGKRSLSADFAEGVDKAIMGMFGSNNIPIVPVPPRKGKIRKNGWDQIDELCFILNKRYGYRIIPLLERVSAIQQKKLDREERVLAKGKNYRIGRNFNKLTGKKGIPEEVVLLDDVITTGITVESCALVLKEAGIRKVHIVSLFFVD